MSPDWGDSGKGKSGGGKGKSGGGKGKSGGGVTPQSGKGKLLAKGKALQEERAVRQAGGPQTEAQERRQKKKDARAASGIPYKPQEPQDTSHQIKVPWPHSLKRYPVGWLQDWKAVAVEMGLSLRYSVERNKGWRDNLAKAAAMWELTITGTPGDPAARARAIHLLSDIVKDTERLLVTADLIDWQTIISTWDGGEQDRISDIIVLSHITFAPTPTHY